jgi:hypothetical protein
MLRPAHGEGLPPAEVRFEELRVEPWPDGRRVKVHVSLTPFQQKPDLEATIFDEAGNEVSHASIIETAVMRFVFTMHIRTQEVAGTYTLSAKVSYQDLSTVDERILTFDLQENAGDHAA